MERCGEGCEDCHASFVAHGVVCIDLMKMRMVVFWGLLGALSAYGCTYSVEVDSISETPVLSFANAVGGGHSPCNLTFNPAFVQKSSSNAVEGLFVRVAECPWEATDHVMFAPCSLESGVCGDLWTNFSFPVGTEDPRVVYVESEQTYYNFMYAPVGSDPPCSGEQCSVVLYTTSADPLQAENWNLVGRYPWHRNGCLLPRPSPPHYILFGEGPPPLPGIGIASTSDFLHYTTLNDSLLTPLGPQYNESKLEAGAPPVKLSTGDYLHLYAAATPTWNPPTTGNYEAGWAILDGTDPSRVVARGRRHVLTPTLPYEAGTGRWPWSRHGVVFLPTAVPLPGQPDRFRVWFGAADANVGTAVLSVKCS